jgi:hypothetical protein
MDEQQLSETTARLKKVNAVITSLDPAVRAAVDALNLRNRCGHPTNTKPGVNKAKASSRTSWGSSSPRSSVLVYAVVDDSLSPTSSLGDSIDVFVRREDAERFIEQIRGDDPELAKPLRIEERELDAGSLN